ncbi:MAG: hypothetical protein NTV84_10740 [Methanoregula sp.]|nr:hypothetical protein [Methanoregula sp.]
MTGETGNIETCSGRSIRIDTPLGEPITHAPKETGTPRDTFTRGRAVEFLAKTILEKRGYYVIRSAGSGSPVDLVAWRCSGPHILVKAERSRNKIHALTGVAAQYRGDIDALRAITLPPLAQRQLWVWNWRSGWRFFEVMAGGISEVADYV